MIPHDIREAAELARKSAPGVSYAEPTGGPGELVVVIAPTDQNSLRRIAAVINRHDQTKTLTIQLATNNVQASSDLDLVVAPDDSGLPFTLAIQSELYGPIFFEQLGSGVGRLSEQHREALAQALLTDGESLEDFDTGLPLAGPGDSRRQFKAEELSELNQLVSECRNWLAGDPVAAQVFDPELLLPPPLGTSIDEAQDRFLELLDVLNAMDVVAIPFPSELLALLGEANLLEEIFRWRADFDLDASRILTRFRITEVEGLDEPPHLAVQRNADVGDRRSDRVLEPYLEVCALAGESVVDIKTTARCWQSEGRVVVVEALGGRYCRARARVLEAA